MAPTAEVITPAKSLFGRAARIGGAAILLVLIAGIVAPFITMASYSGRIREALESALGRTVEFQKLHLTLFSGPGFLLDSVTIGEDPRYGLEAFAYVPTLEARLRLDKLLLGRIQFSSLRLVEPSLNLVKKSDGTWNVVSLVERLSSPRRIPLNLFPVIEVSGGRLNFKLGIRKTTLYISESDLSIYPERSGKLYIQFSGSPARTDRAGNGFGHFRGTATWYATPGSSNTNQLMSNLILDPSNLSEMTTLFEGYDIGVHGTVSSRAHLEGPITDLRLAGDLHLEDVHRWDLLPSSGEDWHIRYGGQVDLLGRHLDIRTMPWHSTEPTPVTVQMHIDDLLRTNHWSITTHLINTAAGNVLPLASRMGLPLPENLSLEGKLDGTIQYAEQEGLSGEVTMRNLAATVPDAPPLTATAASVIMSGDRLHLRPATFQTPNGVALVASGDYVPDTREVTTTLHVTNVPFDVLKSETAAWLRKDPGLGLLTGGDVSGDYYYKHDESSPVFWSGQLQFSGSTLSPPELASPLTRVAGRLKFNDPDFQIDDFSAVLANEPLRGSYRYTAAAVPAERLRLQVAAADLSQAGDLLGPMLGRQDLWARLHFGRHHAPDWLLERDVDGTLDIARFSADDHSLGSLQTHFAWKGTGIQVTSFRLVLPEGSAQGKGEINLSGYAPRYRFTSNVAGLPYKGGTVNASAHWQSSGIGTDALRNFRAGGTFSATGIALSLQDTFAKLSGAFDIAFTNGWPNLRLFQLDATGDDGHWAGEANSQSDGMLVINLQGENGQQRVITSPLSDTSSIPAPSSTGEIQP